MTQFRGRGELRSLGIRQAAPTPPRIASTSQRSGSGFRRRARTRHPRRLVHARKAAQVRFRPAPAALVNRGLSSSKTRTWKIDRCIGLRPRECSKCNADGAHCQKSKYLAPGIILRTMAKRLFWLLSAAACSQRGYLFSALGSGNTTTMASGSPGSTRKGAAEAYPKSFAVI